MLLLLSHDLLVVCKSINSA